MNSSSDARSRAVQQDARAWSTFTGTNYTTALRQMESPLAQGLLGQRVSARRFLDALTNNDVVSGLGEYGIRSGSLWRFNGKTDYVELALVVDMLRMIEPVSAAETAELSSYTLKHTAEWFLSPHCSYVSNGRLIWAAAALGLPISDPEGEGPNVSIRVSEREHDYVRRMVGAGQDRPRTDRYRPAGYEYLRAGLKLAAAGEIISDRWVRPARVEEPAPFHDWLTRQADRADGVGRLASDYAAGVQSSDHKVARNASELLAIFREVAHSSEAYDAVVSAIAEWLSTKPSPAPVRTELVRGDAFDHDGWGAGSGDTERYEYLCPCGDGTIVEEHDNIPGFREHDHYIACARCREEWRFVEDRSVRDWALEPIPSRTA